MPIKEGKGRKTASRLFHLIHIVLVWASPSAAIWRGAASTSALGSPIRRTIGVTVSMAVSMTICVTVGMTIGGTICSLYSLHSPIFIDALFNIQRKGNHQIYIPSGLVPKNIPQLMCKPPVIPKSNR